MKEENHRRKSGLRLVPLITGIYGFLLGLGLTAIGIGDLLGSLAGVSQGGAGIVRFLAGLGLACFGAYGIWDGIRDLIKGKKDTGYVQESQFILTGADGKRSSYVSRETLREQLLALAEAEEGATVSLQILPPVLIQGLGQLLQVSYLYGEAPRLVAFFEAAEGGYAVRQREADPALAETLLGQLLTGSPDFSHWEEGIVTIHPGRPQGQAGRYLRIFGESWQDEHRFFSARDLELAVEGLSEGKYVRVELGLGMASFRIFPSLEESGIVVMHIYFWEEGGFSTYEKKGTMTQVKFWLVKIFHEGLDGVMAGWQEDIF